MIDEFKVCNWIRSKLYSARTKQERKSREKDTCGAMYHTGYMAACHDILGGIVGYEFEDYHG